LTFQPGQSGNLSGRPQTPWRQRLEAALKAAGKRHGRTFLNHLVDQAYTDNTLAAQILNRLLPSLKAIQVEGDTAHSIKLMIQMPGQPGQALGPSTTKAITSREVPNMPASIIPPAVQSSSSGELGSPILAVLADSPGNSQVEARTAPPLGKPAAPLGTKHNPDAPTVIAGIDRPALWLKVDGSPRKGWLPSGQPDGRYWRHQHKDKATQ